MIKCSLIFMQSSISVLFVTLCACVQLALCAVCLQFSVKSWSVPEVFMWSNPTASFWKTRVAVEPLTQILDLILMTKQLYEFQRALKL